MFEGLFNFNSLVGTQCSQDSLNHGKQGGCFFLTALIDKQAYMANGRTVALRAIVKDSLVSIFSARTTLNKVLSFGFPRPISILMMVRTSVLHLLATSSCVRPSSDRAFFTASAKRCEYCNIPIYLKDILQYTLFLFNSPQSICKVYSNSCK